ncbi:MAG: hypothetical protein NVSMB15_09680 [Steroidobacteraceae bacterium]
MSIGQAPQRRYGFRTVAQIERRAQHVGAAFFTFPAKFSKAGGVATMQEERSIRPRVAARQCRTHAARGARDQDRGARH